MEHPAVDPHDRSFPLVKLVNDPPRDRESAGSCVGGVWDESPDCGMSSRGDISLVGPRPRLPEEVLADGLRQSLRLAVRPGATGPWQVNGHSSSLHGRGRARLGLRPQLVAWENMKILARTPWAIVSGKGAY